VTRFVKAVCQAKSLHFNKLRFVLIRSPVCSRMEE
jgi:hypothetical protein